MQPEVDVILPDAAVVKGLDVWDSVQSNLMSIFHEFLHFNLQEFKLYINQSFSASEGVNYEQKLNHHCTQGHKKYTSISIVQDYNLWHIINKMWVVIQHSVSVLQDEASSFINAQLC